MDDGLLGEGEMSNSKLHVCQHCKATFVSPYTLRRHEYTHTGQCVQNQFLIGIAYRTYKQNSHSAKDHYLCSFTFFFHFHTGERPFWCHLCNMGFIQKYRLLKHTFACHGEFISLELFTFGMYYICLGCLNL